MKKVITALGNPILNNELKKYKEFEVMINDVQYKEAIIEFLEIEKNIDYIILNEILPGNILLEDLINEIKIKNDNIQIIIILEKENKQLENFLHNRKIYNIFYNNMVEINDIIKILKNKKILNNETIEKEIQSLKNIIIDNSVKRGKIKFSNSIKKDIKIKNKMFCILGDSGVGKSIFSVCISNFLKNNKNKILIFDFDILNNSIHTILGVKEYPEGIREKNINNKFNVNNLIIKINKNIHLLSGVDLLVDSEEKINEIELIKIIKKIKKQYDYIIVDTSSECYFNYNKILIENSDLNIFLLEGNLLEITKANKLLQMYKNNWKINSKKIKILINKYNKNSVDEKIIKNIFSEYELIGKIKMSNLYNNIINKNNKIINKKNPEMREYKKIGDKIIKVNFRQNNYLLKNIINVLFEKIK